MSKNEKTSSQQVFDQYEKGKNYNLSIDLYERVKTNEKLYLGEHWEGVRAPNIVKPVINIVRRVINYMIAFIVTDDIAIAIEPFFKEGELVKNMEFLTKEVKKIFERTAFKGKNRDFLRNAAIDGDAFFHLRFDPDVPTGQISTGSIDIEVVNSTDVIYGNPYDYNIDDQPYIILVEQKNIDTLKNELKNQKKSFEEDDLIADDDALIFDDKKKSDQLVTVLHKYYRQGKTIFYTRVTKNIVLDAPKNLGYNRYPIVQMVWEKKRGSCHGYGVADGVKDNQLAINKMASAMVASVMNYGFPKMIYNATKIDRWDPNPNKAIAVNGDIGNVSDAVSAISPKDMSGQVFQVINQMSSMTQEVMGASDAALGNVRPDNTSAIIAVQRATAAPLDLQLKSYHQAIEELVRGIVDIITTDYGWRWVWDEEYNSRIVVDFSVLKEEIQDINVDIGAGAYFSGILQQQTLSNLFDRQIINATELLNGMPDNLMPNKNEVLQRIQQQEEQAMMMPPPGAEGAGGLDEMGGLMNAMPEM